MKKIDDSIWIDFEIATEKDGSFDYEAFFKSFDSFFTIKTTIIYPKNRKGQKINGFLDKKIQRIILEETKKGNLSIELENDTGSLGIILTSRKDRNRYGFAISIDTEALIEKSVVDLYQFFNDLLNLKQAIFAKCSFEKISNKIYDRYYEDNDRTFFSDGLVWLQYFGLDEFHCQGGEAIFSNPHIQTERLGKGVLIQVGESPYDAYTPEGEKLLLKATKAMPPVVKN